MERWLVFLLIVADGVLVAVGQFFIKAGMLRINQAVASPFSHPGRVLAEMLRSPQIWAGVGISVACFVLWAFVLTKASLLVAGPLMNAIFYIALVAISVWVLGERLSAGKVLGVAMLLLAIAVLARERM